MKTWNLKKQNDWNGIQIVDPDTNETHATIDGATPEALALIAAAPELLEALKEARALMSSLPPDLAEIETMSAEDSANKIEAAIAKAEGRDE